MDNQQNITQPDQNTNLSQPPQTHRKGKKIILAFGIALLILAAFGGLYYWQNSKNQDLQSQLNASKAEITKLQQSTTQPVSETPAAAPKTPTNDEQILAAVKSYCNATVDPDTKQALVLKVGTAGASQKQVLYSSDKNFAYVNAVCSKDGTTDGSGSAYYLKKANDTWLVLYRGQMTSPEMTAQFNIPSDFK
jgi:hypothetical protein